MARLYKRLDKRATAHSSTIRTTDRFASPGPNGFQYSRTAAPTRAKTRRGYLKYDVISRAQRRKRPDQHCVIEHRRVPSRRAGYAKKARKAPAFLYWRACIFILLLFHFFFLSLASWLVSAFNAVKRRATMARRRRRQSHKQQQQQNGARVEAPGWLPCVTQFNSSQMRSCWLPPPERKTLAPDFDSLQEFFLTFFPDLFTRFKLQISNVA